MDNDDVRLLLCDLGATIRDEVLAQRAVTDPADLQAQVGRVAADVTYGIDKISEDRVLRWMGERWPEDEPVRLVMEGIEDDELVVFPTGTPPPVVRWLCIVDPIDGTRNLMYDKRAGWVLAAAAPARTGVSTPEARLQDVVASAMTEIPTTRQWRADQYSGIVGCGPDRLVCEAFDVRAGTSAPVRVSPTTATALEHGFASFSHYLADGKAWLATVEQELWDQLIPPSDRPREIFEDQYICSAGQLAEVLCGRDRLVGDLRPFAWEAAGRSSTMSCHPYDICTSMLLIEAGGIFESPLGGPVDCPLDTTTPVAWVAYANQSLADLVGPPLAQILRSR